MNSKKPVSSTERMDALDRKILGIISQNARIPFRDVALQCGVSRAAIHQRVQKMFDDGVITGSGYHVNPRSIGYNTCTYVGLTLEKGSMYHQVVAELDQIPEVVEAQYTLGAFGILIKVFAHDNEHLLTLLNTKIQAIPGVADTTTLTALAQPIYRQLPIEI
jgi:Lrp/AsnC family transcriptional regulator for asnA, asnC and gidA